MGKSGKSKRGRGDGAVETLPSGLFRARVRVDADPATGKPGRTSKTFRTVTAAKTWLREQLVKKDRGGLAVNPRGTLVEWYLVWIASKQDSTSPSTWVKYRQHFTKHIIPTLGPVKFRDLTPAAVTQWSHGLGESGVSPVQRTKVMKTLSICCNDAVLAGKLNANPLRPGGGVKRPKVVRPEIEIYTAEESRKVVHACNSHRLGPLFLLLFDSGCRTGEALALTWDKIDLVAGKVLITRSLQEVRSSGRPTLSVKETKTDNGRRTVSLAAQTVAVIARFRDGGTGTGIVFPSKLGWYLTKNSVCTAWKKISRTAGVQYRRPYTLRHTSASLLIQSGISIKTVSRRLGHADIAITLRFYSHLMADSDEQAAQTIATHIYPPESAAH